MTKGACTPGTTRAHSHESMSEEYRLDSVAEQGRAVKTLQCRDDAFKQHDESRDAGGRKQESRVGFQPTVKEHDEHERQDIFAHHENCRRKIEGPREGNGGIGDEKQP